jgi:radical SAM protein with 4Fe4S-binding SPASM domain
MKIVKTLGGMFKGAEFRIHKRKGTGLPPSFLVYQVTKKCNGRCSFCNIWKAEQGEELTVEDLDKLFSKPFMQGIRWVNLTGGEPFLRKDLPEVATVMKKKLPEIELVAVPTNGFATNKTLDGTMALLDALRRKGPDGKVNPPLLSVTVSFDGLGDAHDKNRGITGGFEKALESLIGLKEIANGNESLEVGIQVVITRENIDHLKEIFDYFWGFTQHINFTPVTIIPSKYEGTLSEDMVLREEDIEKMENFFGDISRKLPAYAYYLSKVLDIKKKKRGGKRTYPCLGGYTTMYLDANGYVYPCAILPSYLRIGNIRNKDVENIWMDADGDAMRVKLKKFKFCEVCTNNCDIVANLKEETINFLAYLLANPIVFVSLIHDICDGKMKKYI